MFLFVEYIVEQEDWKSVIEDLDSYIIGIANLLCFIFIYL